jgi:hypothetical protein
MGVLRFPARSFSREGGGLEFLGASCGLPVELVEIVEDAREREVGVVESGGAAKPSAKAKLVLVAVGVDPETRHALQRNLDDEPRFVGWPERPWWSSKDLHGMTLQGSRAPLSL